MRVPGMWCAVVLILVGVVLASGIADCRLLESRDIVATGHRHLVVDPSESDAITESACRHTDLDGGSTHCSYNGVRADAVLTRTDETGPGMLDQVDPLFGTDPWPTPQLRGPPRSSTVRVQSGPERLIRICIRRC
ncbi:hypothetical protein NCAST_34_01640 [Nocardia asteroides NBRC 15531]|uniref:Uncharacterized protein n=1 Tax=Nocardia asteroides NBRC 15531 TaxID=1110697 RepID=U5EKW6_NOCAS|nr:hypothetical protein NCAST_34_01640 [Nocardia asteroides NBRC 15531]